MKTLLFTFSFLLFTFFSYSQGDFKAESGTIIWQKVFTPEQGANIETLATQLASVNVSAEVITGTFNSATINYAAQGVKRMAMPIYMVEPFNASVVIERKNDRYRVSVNNIVFKDMAGRTRNAAESFTPLQNYVFKNSGEIRTNQIKALEIFSNDLTQRFTVKTTLADW